MPYFPQLSSGATGQYPTQKRRIARTIINQLPDGNIVKFADAGGERVEWQLAFQDLTDSELIYLQQFFWRAKGSSMASRFSIHSITCWHGAKP